MPTVEVDWLRLWRELVTTVSDAESSEHVTSYHTRFRRKTHERPDPILDFVLKDMDTRGTVLDIGAGSGRWTIAIAKVARSVTAVEPSEAMVSMLRENIAANKLNNIQVLPSTWEEAIVEPHDIVVCVHSIYSSPDFAGFVRKMEKFTKKRCYLALRLPPYNGVIGELSLQIYGHRHDSPNAIIAYNALYAMGIYANVLVEEGIYRWVDSTLEEAFHRAKRHLHLGSTNVHDELIRSTLSRRLTCVDNSYVWPDGMRMAVLWWSPSVISE